MATEIERTWLVADDGWRGQVTSATEILQAYLAIAPDRSVRVRIRDDRAVLTVKTGSGGRSREEVEVPLAVEDARTLADGAVTVGSVIRKTRHLVPLTADLTAEVDEFHDANDGLVVVEVELPSLDTEVPAPDWFGLEVSDDARYLNASLAEHPYGSW